MTNPFRGEQECTGGSEPALLELEIFVGEITVQAQNCIRFIIIYFTQITAQFPFKVDEKGFRWPAALDILLSDPGVITPG